MDTRFPFILSFFICIINGVFGDESKSRGFGEDIDWVPFKDGLILSRESRKPLMLVIHKSWCGACKALKPRFAASEEIHKLSSRFVMVNVEDDEEPDGVDFQPDGSYIPRILFLNSDGQVQKDLINTLGNPKYQYYYSSAIMVVEAMKNALAKLVGSATEEL